MATGTCVVDFGTAGSFDTSVAVADATVVAGTKVDAYILVPASDSPRFRDEYWVEELEVFAGGVSAGVGYTVFAKCGYGVAFGQFTINWVTV